MKQRVLRGTLVASLAALAPLEARAYGGAPAAPATTIVGEFASIVTGADGLGLISYQDTYNGDLKVAHCENALCTTAVITTLDRDGNVGVGTAAALGADGLGLIAYNDLTLGLKVAHCSNAACTIATLTRVDDGRVGAVATGADGLPLIAYRGSSDSLKVAHCSDVLCSTATVTTLDSPGPRDRLSVAIGPDGRALIAYGNGLNGDLQVAHCTDLLCTTASFTVLDAGDVGDASLAFGPDGLGLIAYHDLAAQDLKVAHCQDALCTAATRSTIDAAGNTGDYPSLAIGPDGLGLISYYLSDDGDLRVAHCTDAACANATLATPDAGGFVGRHSTITIGGDGSALIAYYDASRADLKAAHCSDAACTAATLSTLDGFGPTSGPIGQGTSIAKGSDGLGLISYWNGVTQDLMVAHCTSLQCDRATSTILDSAGNVGQYSSLAIGTDGLGLISYHDLTNGALKVAHCSNVPCTEATVHTLDSAGQAGQYTSVAIGSDGLGLISYIGANGLQVAHCSDVPCTSATLSVVDPLGTGWTSIAIGTDGRGLIAYSAPWLKTAHCADLLCASATLGHHGGTGEFVEHVSVTIGSDGLPLITCLDGFRTYLLSVTHCGNPACTSSTYAHSERGYFPSVATGSDGLGLVSFHGYLSDLRVAHCPDAACTNPQITALDSAGQVGLYTSIAIGADGFGLISYLGLDPGELKVAHCANVPCTAATVATLDGPTRYHALPPCRVLDTRPSQPLLANQSRTVAVAGLCGVPADARAVAANQTVVGPGDNGNLRVHPTDSPLPSASALNFAAGVTRANSAMLRLGTGGQVDVRCDMPAGSAAGAHFVLDVYGYFK